MLLVMHLHYCCQISVLVHILIAFLIEVCSLSMAGWIASLLVTPDDVEFVCLFLFIAKVGVGLLLSICLGIEGKSSFELVA